MASKLLAHCVRVNFKLKCVRQFGIQAKVLGDHQQLEILSESCVRKFPFLWLRDNCKCTNCFNAETKSRILDWESFNTDVKIQNVKTNGDEVQITWDDNHRSNFKYNWLKERSFAKEDQEKFIHKNVTFPKQLWNKNDFAKIFKTFDYSQVVKSNSVLHDFLTTLAKTGIVLIDAVPEDESESVKVVDRIGFSRTTHYGEKYEVKAEKNLAHIAYSPSVLQLHTDLSYYKYKPGITMLHCVQQAKAGGQNLLVDAFYIAEKLRREQKDVFDLLTNVNVLFSDVGVRNEREFHKIHQVPIISLDANGEIQDINENVLKRDSHFLTDIENVTQWYKAKKIFITECYKGAVNFQFRPGQILLFDNTRLLHGRKSYKDGQNNSRLLVGMYMDWDEVYSKIRVLRKNLHITN